MIDRSFDSTVSKVAGSACLPTIRARACAIIIGFLLLVSNSSAAAYSAQLLFSPDEGENTGSIETILPLSRIGSVPLARGRLAIRGDTAEVSMVPEWQFDAHIVLSGKVLDTRVQNDGSVSSIRGVMFLNAGEWSSYFDDKTALESVTTASSTLLGRITRITSFDIELTQLDGHTIGVPLSTVLALQSPRAFNFSIPLSTTQTAPLKQPVAVEVNHVSITELGRTFRLTQLKTIVRRERNDGDLSTAKLVALGTAASFADLAQLAPLLGIPLGLQPLLNRREYFKEIKFNVNSGFNVFAPPPR